MSRIVCISNRVSLPNPETGTLGAGGLAVGVRAALECKGGGLWFGWDGTKTDPGITRRKPAATVQNDITFLTFPLTQTEYRHYYLSAANEALWPLMHQLGNHIAWSLAAAGVYARVNRLFARTVRPYLRPDDLIWVHDYHLLPLGRELRRLGVRNRIGYFNHIPMPGREFLDGESVPKTLRAFFADLRQSLFSYDLVGFQSFRDFRNFASFLPGGGRPCPERFESVRIRSQGQAAAFGVFPISIETTALLKQARESAGGAQRDKDCRLLIGAERLDYTKGLTARFEAYAEFLRCYPDYCRRVLYQQITPLSRSDIRAYQDTIARTRDAAAAVQEAFGEPGWSPVEYSEKPVPRAELMRYFRRADVGLVTPLIDGQNLVAKEYLAAQDPLDPGMLVLSRTAGAAEELAGLGVLCVDPENPADIAGKIRKALETPRAERMEFFSKAVRHLYRYDIAHWAESFLDALAAAGEERDIAVPSRISYSERAGMYGQDS